MIEEKKFQSAINVLPFALSVLFVVSAFLVSPLVLNYYFPRTLAGNTQECIEKLHEMSKEREVLGRPVAPTELAQISNLSTNDELRYDVLQFVKTELPFTIEKQEKPWTAVESQNLCLAISNLRREGVLTLELRERLVKCLISKYFNVNSDIGTYHRRRVFTVVEALLNNECS